MWYLGVNQKDFRFICGPPFGEESCYVGVIATEVLFDDKIYVSLEMKTRESWWYQEGAELLYVKKSTLAP